MKYKVLMEQARAALDQAESLVAEGAELTEEKRGEFDRLMVQADELQERAVKLRAVEERDAELQVKMSETHAGNGRIGERRQVVRAVVRNALRRGEQGAGGSAERPGWQGLSSDDRRSERCVRQVLALGGSRSRTRRMADSAETDLPVGAGGVPGEERDDGGADQDHDGRGAGHIGRLCGTAERAGSHRKPAAGPDGRARRRGPGGRADGGQLCGRAGLYRGYVPPIAGAIRGAWGAETQTPAEKNATMGMTPVVAHVYTYKVSMSQSLVEDAANLVDLVQSDIGDTLAIDEDVAFLVGDGNGKPHGHPAGQRKHDRLHPGAQRQRHNSDGGRHSQPEARRRQPVPRAGRVDRQQRDVRGNRGSDRRRGERDLRRSERVGQAAVPPISGRARRCRMWRAVRSRCCSAI